MVTVVPRDENSWGEIGERLTSGVSQGYMNRADEMALQKAISGLGEAPSARQILDAIIGTRTYTPASKQNLLNNYLGIEQMEEVKRKSRAQEELAREKNQVASVKNAPADPTKLRQNYLEAGYPEYEADLMANPDVTPATKQAIAKQHADLIARNIRQPMNSNTSEIQSNASPLQKPVVAKEDLLPTEQDMPVLEKEVISVSQPEWPQVPPPPETTNAEREKWRSANQKENNKLLQQTKEKTKSHTNALIRYGRLTNLNNSNELPEGLGRLVINPTTGEPYAVASLTGLVNKETQDFVKTMNDFMIDAKNYFGSRVTNFDVQAFKSRLPTLLNTTDGRRLIIEQMKLMEELQTVHDKTLEDGLKHYGRNASYSDVQKIVDEKTAAKEEALINKLNSLDKASDYMDLMAKDPKFKDTTLWQNPKTGKFKAFSPKDALEAKARGWIQW